MKERIKRMNVRKMKLKESKNGREDRIVDRKRSVDVGRRIDEEIGIFIERLMNKD